MVTTNTGDWIKDVAKAFPFGAIVVTDGEDGTHFGMVDLEARRDVTGGWEVRGWAYPNKDIVLSLNDVEIRADGWILKTKTRRYLLKTMGSTQAKQIKANMEAM